MKQCQIAPLKLALRGLVLCIVLGFATNLFADPAIPSSLRKVYETYWPSLSCKMCHDRIFDEYLRSTHAKSFSDPLFKAQYFMEVLPEAEKDPDLYREAQGCIACHSPIDFIVLNGRVFSEDQVDPLWSGVTCDFCHTVTGYIGETPGNGNYISKPSDQRKLGPFLHEYNWHHVYGKLQTKSEFCGICHNAMNRHGLEVKSTFAEWKMSHYSADGIQCQDCHMNRIGYLVSGKPTYESGFAANPSMTFGRGTTYHPVLYTHRFPGAHSRTQIVGAGVIATGIETEKTVSPGDTITIDVLVDNSKTGHKMPSGSKELRQMWLEVTAHFKDRIVSIPASSAGIDEYDVAGQGKADNEILGDDVPKGSRIYRAVFVDSGGQQTLSFYDAVKIVFDNRLEASEIRREKYTFTVPRDARDKITLRASLNYLPYPSSFSRRFGLPRPQRFEVASSVREIEVQ